MLKNTITLSLHKSTEMEYRTACVRGSERDTFAHMTYNTEGGGGY